MHDTCEAGPNFISNLSSKTINNDIRIHWTSNLGIYRNSTLVSNSSLLNNFKSNDNPNYIEDRVNKYNNLFLIQKVLYRIFMPNNLESYLSFSTMRIVLNKNIYTVFVQNSVFSLK